MDITFSRVVQIVREFNGSVVEHSADSVVAVWPDQPPWALRRKVKAATLCALKISAVADAIRADQQSRTRGVELETIRCGVGDGNVTLLVCGGCLGRLYCVPVGPAVRQAQDALAILAGKAPHENVCLSAGCSAQVTASASGTAGGAGAGVSDRAVGGGGGGGGAVAGGGSEIAGGFCFLGAPLGRSKFQTATAAPGALDPSNVGTFSVRRAVARSWYEDAGVEQEELQEDLEYNLGRFLPGPVIKCMSPEFPDLELWTNELRTISCVVVDVEVTADDLRCPMLQSRISSGNSQDDRLCTAVHLIVQRVQYETYKYEGTVISAEVLAPPNKAMRDGKPIVTVVRCVLGYGLPPLVRPWSAAHFGCWCAADGWWRLCCAR